MSKEMEAMIAAAKERLHRSIGQRARWAQAAIAAKAAELREGQGSGQTMGVVSFPPMVPALLDRFFDGRRTWVWGGSEWVPSAIEASDD